MLCNPYYSHARSTSGTIYPYFVCTGRNQKTTDCTRRTLHTADVETPIEDYYRNIRIPPETVAALHETLNVELDRLTASASQEAADLTARRVNKLADPDTIDARLAEHRRLRRSPHPQRRLPRPRRRDRPPSTPDATATPAGSATRPSSSRSTSTKTAPFDPSSPTRGRYPRPQQGPRRPHLLSGSRRHNARV